MKATLPPDVTTRAAQSPELASLRDVLASGLDIKLHLLQHVGEMARLLGDLILEDEVGALCGERYSRDKPKDGRFCRWGSNPGSIRVEDERVPISVPRVRDVESDVERPLESYQAMKAPMEVSPRMEEALLLGLSQRDYGRVASTFVDGFGLSQSSVSRAFQERSSRALEAFEARSLAEEDIVALVIDGKYLVGAQMVICLGVTMDGRKLPLGFVETSTENAEAIKGLLADLIHRGLRFSEGLLCVIDGAKGLYKAVRDVFGEVAQVQRCQWHKRENVVSYLPKKDQPSYRRRLQSAYQKTDHASAKAALLDIHGELIRVNRSAARSLLEGLDETLTLHRLGLFNELGTSLKTTNCIENLNGQLDKYIGRVKRWMHSDQRQRWMALALLEVEQKMRRINSHEHLHLLRSALKNAIPISQNAQGAPTAEESFN